MHTGVANRVRYTGKPASARRLLSDRLSFEIVHHCNTCDMNWILTPDEIATLQKQFAKDSK